MEGYTPTRQIPDKKSSPSPAPPPSPPPDKPKQKSYKEKKQDELRRDILAHVELLRILDDAEEAKRSLKSFLKMSWPIVSPGTDFQDNWHVDCIVEHVEALMRRDIRRLIINIPPRMLKSQIIYVCLPAWRWLDEPSEKFLVASYGRQLALRDSRRCRNLITSKWYQDRWGSSFKLAVDQNEKGRFENDMGGFRIIASVEGGVLGEGGSCCVVGTTRIMTDRGELPINEIVERRLPVRILGSEGTWQSINDYTRSVTYSLIEIKTETGETLRCTDEHPVWMYGRGYVRAKEVLESFHAHQNLYLRRLLPTVRTQRQAYGAIQNGKVLLTKMFRRVRAWAAQSGMDGRSSDTRMSILRREVSSKAGSRQTRSSVLFNVLQTASSVDRKTFEAQGLSGLQETLSASARRESALLTNLRQQRPSSTDSGGCQLALQERELEECVHAGISEVVERSDQETRRQSMRDMSLAVTTSRSSHRRFQDESRSTQSRNSVHFMSSERAHAIRDTEGVDERVRVSSVRRVAETTYVYNLVVAPRHDYYADGILTHNCLYDDPNDLAKMISEPETYPQFVREWYSGTASSRNIDPRSDVRLCIQQRSSYGGDLTEYLLELGGWDQLVIPNEYDGRSILGPLAYPDPRIHPGDLLFPARLGPEETDILKREQKQHYAGQFNQSPTAIGKSGLKREWFNFYVPRGSLVKELTSDGIERIRPIRISLANGGFIEKTPIELPIAFEQTLHSLDCAFKGNEENDFVADHVWSRSGANTFLLHREHGHWNFPETLQMVRRVSTLYPSPEKLVEDKANGPAVIQTLRNEIPGLIPVNPEGGKWSRVAAISGYVEAGNVYLPSPDLYPYVWDLLAEFSAGQSAKHDDDTDAMTQALKRLYDAQAQSGLPEFRVQPLTGEPPTACHVQSFIIPSDWRRYCAIVPNRAALWLAESPSGAIRVYRELNLDRMDATTVGQNIAAFSLSDLQRQAIQSIRPPAAFSQSFDLYMPKSAFSVIESVGCWAELMEAALLVWDKPDGEWEERKASMATIRAARFRSEMIEEETVTALDRLRELLAFSPPDWQPCEYDRKLALALAEKDLNEYHDYMARVEGQVRGEWPKLKISPLCPQLVSQIGTVRRDKLDEMPPFIEALLLGVSVSPRAQQREVVARPYLVGGSQSSLRNKTLLSRKFAMR